MATGLLLVPLAAAGVWAGARSRQEREVELSEQAVSLAHSTAAYLDLYFKGLDSMAMALTRHPGVLALDRAACEPLFSEVLENEPLLMNVVLTDGAGVLKASGLPERWDHPPTVTLPYVQQVVQENGPVVSDLTRGLVSGRPTVVLAYPVGAAGMPPVGVLAIGLNIMRLQTLFASTPLPEGSVVTLSDSHSRVLTRSLDAERYIGQALSANPEPPRQVATTSTITGPDGIERFYGNAVVTRGPWLLSVGIPRSVAAARVAPLWRRTMLIVLVTITSVLALAIWLASEASRDLNALRAAAQRIAGGDLSPPRRVKAPNLEFGQLQDAFITMAANLRETHDALDRRVEQEREMREMLQSLQRQVVRQERLTAVGLLVSGVAHELNNPLQAILGTLEILERDTTLAPDIQDEIAFVKTQSGRAREIIRNLSRFSSQQSGPPAQLDLRDVINEVIQLRRRDLNVASIALDVEVSSTRKVFANFTEIEQVVLNFVINAQQSIEATGRGAGRILIRLYDAGKRVGLEVWDDGPGVQPEDEPKLFQPFFTTKPVGKGTGLGLSVSYGIIDAYGGTIGYRGNEWGGALFYFELPVSDTPAAEGSRGPHDRSPVLHRPISPPV